MLCTNTRVFADSKPSAHRQWKATGRLTTNAAVPLHRCSGAIQPGAGPAPGNRPHIHSADSSWTTTNTTTSVVSQAFICSIPENPRVNRGRNVGSCNRPYTPIPTATAAPRTKAAVSGPADPRAGAWAVPVTATAPSCAAGHIPNREGAARRPGDTRSVGEAGDHHLGFEQEGEQIQHRDHDEQ